MKTRLLAGAALAAVFAASGASAQDTGWYGALDLGWHSTRTINFHAANGLPGDPPIKADLKDSWAGFARVGYKLSPHLRLELEGGYRPAQINSISDGSDSL